MSYVFQPIKGYIAVIKRPPETGIIILNGSKLPDPNQTLEALVVSVGEGAFTKKGKRKRPIVAPGDLILIKHFAGTSLKINQDEYTIITEYDIVCGVERGEDDDYMEIR